MPNLRERLMPVADNLRGLPNTLGFRTKDFRIRTRVWPGKRGDDTAGAPVDTDVTITPRPRIKAVSGKEVADSGGRYEETDYKVGPITPAYDVDGKTGGYTDADLQPTAPNAQTEILYLVDGDEFELIDMTTDRAMARTLIIRRKETSR